ncbi:MAG: sensor histidine kinase KdpD [Chloroflexota bacterium]|nr:sensor histidine kinase KdpD [Chloroflexota bacterium]
MRQERGRLKIFLGMATGVGKTYAMLDAAQEQRSSGADVVIALVETHGRAETEALIDPLEVIPRRLIDYRGTALTEMDTDAVIVRAPALALVDELAHSNVPGSRHSKRYQDVVELLEHGIDVYTTVNVQHFESRADLVRQITGIPVQETIPDSLLDLANEIELIDLSPEDLRRRLYEGRVYTVERVDLAANNFFRIGNLTALREMALRLAAEHVDHQLQDYMQIKRIAGPWRSGERLLVAVGPSPFSERLIRWTRRTAYNLEAPWLACYVQTSQTLTPEAQERLAKHLALARELGGEVVTSSGDDIVETMLRAARQRNVTQIVIGKPKRSRLHRLVLGSLVDTVIAHSGEIDVYVVNGDDSESESERRAPLLAAPTESALPDYLNAIGVVAAVTALNLLLASALPWIGYQVIGFTELLAVLLVAAFIGRGPAFVAAIASAALWSALFVAPNSPFGSYVPQDLVIIALYFVIALVAGNLTARVRRQERAARYAAERAMALYTLAHETASAVDRHAVLTTAVTQLGRVFDAQIAVVLASGGRLDSEAHPASTLILAEKEIAVARWVYEHDKPAGRFTDTLSSSESQYRPLLTPNRTVGVIGIRSHQETRLSFDQEVLLETFINQVSLVIERELLDEAAEQAAMLHESERLYNTLFNSISHELRTPIATIAGAISSIKEDQKGRALDPHNRAALIDDIADSAQRLNRLVENLLDMSRLESGRLELKLDWGDLRDVIGAVVKRLDTCFAAHPLILTLAPDLPLMKMDVVLIEQALANLIENACRYTPSGTPIRIAAHRDEDMLAIVIADQGAGIPVESIGRVFDKFYRAPGTATGGTGLGLSIVRGLIETHGGTVNVVNAPDGGARFTIRLPITDSPPPVHEAAS